MADLFEKVDWTEVQARLVANTTTLFPWTGGGSEPVLQGFGHGPEDFAQEAIVRLLDPDDTSIAWKSKTPPTTGGVVALLSRVITRDFIDCKRSPRTHVAPVVTASGDDSEDDKMDAVAELADTDSPDEVELLARVHRQRKVQELLERIDEDDIVLREYLGLQFDGTDYVGYPRRVVAEKLGLSVSEVTNVKKRLQRVLLALVDVAPGT